MEIVFRDDHLATERLRGADFDDNVHVEVVTYSVLQYCDSD